MPAGCRPAGTCRACLLRYAMSLSPCSTLISTDGWLSSAVVNTSERFVGIVVLRSMSFVMIWPLVSMPRDSGVTSRSRTSFTSPLSTPAWIAAPTATASSGLIPLSPSLPVSSLDEVDTAGMRVEPPTSSTWSILSLVRPASRIAWSNGPRHASSRSWVSSWNFARESVSSRCSGPSRGGGDERQVDRRLLQTSSSSIFAFSAASLRRCVAILSAPRSTPCAFLNSADHPVDDPLVPVVATEVGVAGGRLHLEHALAELEHRHVERAAAEVEDEDR